MRAHSSRKPRALLRGMKVLDYRSGEELFMYDPRTRIQNKQYVSAKMFDTLTDLQRAEQIEGIMNTIGRNYSFNIQG